ncbi:MAG: chemotaxis protein CheW [Gammaproteobacteria bacterium]
MTSDGNTGERWLAPSAALNRFNPPPGTGLGSARPKAAVRSARFGFRIGDLRLLIRPDALSEVITQTPIYPVPNVPSWFLGLINLRGNLLPVFDLHQVLGMGEGARNNSKRTVLILDQGKNAAGIPIDGLPQSVALDRQLRNVPPVHEALEQHTAAAYSTAGGIWLEFDHVGFFTALGGQLSS